MSTAAPVANALRIRILSGAVFGAIVLTEVYDGGLLFSLVTALAAAIAVREWGRMVLTGRAHHRLFVPCVAVLSAAAVLWSAAQESPLVGLAALAVVAAGVVAARRDAAGGWLGLGLVYIGASLSVMIWLRNVHVDGMYHMLTLLAIVWSSDICAYLAGRALGGRKLAPRISPNKTWAGFWGSSLGAAAVGGLLASPVVLDRFSVVPIGNFSWVQYAAIGFVLGMVGQAGDLLVSFFKRRHGVKDTGSILPGHGGLLDRIDALMLVTLAFAVLAWIL